VDYYDVTFVDIQPARRFHERSSSLFLRQWEHRRTLETIEGGCCVTDRVQYEMRLPWVGGALRPLFRKMFENRHRFLRAAFDVLASDTYAAAT
jgi:ligand-binding SRPBCC domain-containing protein